MVQQDHVIAFVGNLSPFGDQVETAELSNLQVPLIGGDGLFDSISQTNPWVFSASGKFENQTNSLAHDLVQAGYTKFAMFTCVESPICSNLKNYLTQQIPAAGGTIVTSGLVSITQPSFATQCQQAQAAGATAILSGMDGASAVRFADNCAQSFNYHPEIGSVSLEATAQVAADPNLNGTIIPNGVFPFPGNTTPGEQLFHTEVNTFDPSLTPSAADTDEWASGMLAVAASKDLGSNPTTAQFIQGLESISNNDLGGIVPALTFTATSRSVADCSFLFVVQNGKFTAGQNGQCVAP